MSNLVPCPACQSPTSPMAKACPRCGHPFDAPDSAQGSGPGSGRAPKANVGGPVIPISMGRLLYYSLPLGLLTGLAAYALSRENEPTGTAIYIGFVGILGGPALVLGGLALLYPYFVAKRRGLAGAWAVGLFGVFGIFGGFSWLLALAYAYLVPPPAPKANTAAAGAGAPVAKKPKRIKQHWER